MARGESPHSLRRIADHAPFAWTSIFSMIAAITPFRDPQHCHSLHPLLADSRPGSTVEHDGSPRIPRWLPSLSWLKGDRPSVAWLGCPGSGPRLDDSSRGIVRPGRSGLLPSSPAPPVDEWSRWRMARRLLDVLSRHASSGIAEPAAELLANALATSHRDLGMPPEDALGLPAPHTGAHALSCALAAAREVTPLLPKTAPPPPDPVMPVPLF